SPASSIPSSPTSNSATKGVLWRSGGPALTKRASLFGRQFQEAADNFAGSACDASRSSARQFPITRPRMIRRLPILLVESSATSNTKEGETTSFVVSQAARPIGGLGTTNI